MLEVSVLEVSSSRVSQLGLLPPSSVSVGLIPNSTSFGSSVPTSPGQLTYADRHNLTALVANPLLVANLTADVTHTNVLANPKIRAKNREKAHIQVGDRLPVFTTVTTANVRDVVERHLPRRRLRSSISRPQVQLDNEVTIKVSLEVRAVQVRRFSSFRTTNPRHTPSTRARRARRCGSRTVRTEIPAGLINDSDLKETIGVPGLSEAPAIGYLFGNHKTNDSKTEVVLLITPHVIRNLPVPADAGSTLASGTEARPGVAAPGVARSTEDARAVRSAAVADGAAQEASSEPTALP